jgi:hypothetical protein
VGLLFRLVSVSSDQLDTFLSLSGSTIPFDSFTRGQIFKLLHFLRLVQIFSGREEIPQILK